MKLAGCEAWIFRMGGRSAVWATERVRLAVRTDSPTEVTNLMDERISGGSALSFVTVDPLAPAFFDANVRSVSEDSTAASSATPSAPITF